MRRPDLVRSAALCAPYLSPIPALPTHRSATRYLLLAGGCRLAAAARRDRCSASSGWSSQALVPAVIGKAIDAGLTARDGSALLTWGAALLGLAVAAGRQRHHPAPAAPSTTGWRRPTAPSSSPSGRPTGSAPRLPKRLATGEVVSIGTSDISHIGNAIDITARGAGAVVADHHRRGDPAVSASVPLGLVVMHRRAGADGRRRPADPAAAPPAAGLPGAAGAR